MAYMIALGFGILFVVLMALLYRARWIKKRNRNSVKKGEKRKRFCGFHDKARNISHGKESNPLRAGFLFELLCIRTTFNSFLLKLFFGRRGYF